MAQRDFTIPLKEAAFPMLSSQHPRTIMGGGAAPMGDVKTPAVVYMHNVMPTPDGLTSVGYVERVAAVSGGVNHMLRAVSALDNEGNKYLIGVSKAPVIYFSLPGGGWQVSARSITLWGGASAEVFTYGAVNNITYIYELRNSCFILDSAGTNDYLTVALTGLTAANILGICAAGGYLIAYDQSSVSWSSTIDPTDFVPSSVTGAGGGSVADLGGDILFCLTNSSGFLIYTESNIISATVTGNRQYPFKFKVVSGGVGGLSASMVAHEATAEAQFAYTPAGVQRIANNRADLILPDLSAFAASRVLEDFDDVTDTFSELTLTRAVPKRLNYIGSRYIVLSYGNEDLLDYSLNDPATHLDDFSHAIVYDIGLNRYGKLKYAHNDCVLVNSAVTNNSPADIDVLASIGVLNKDGSLYAAYLSDTPVSFSFGPTTLLPEGTVILGKLQYSRNRTFTLLEVELEDIPENATLAVSALVSLDGKTTSSAVVGTQYYSVAGVRKFRFRVTGLSISVLVKGEFNLNTAFVRYMLNGRR